MRSECHLAKLRAYRLSMHGPKDSCSLADLHLFQWGGGSHHYLQQCIRKPASFSFQILIIYCFLLHCQTALMHMIAMIHFIIMVMMLAVMIMI